VLVKLEIARVEKNANAPVRVWALRKLGKRRKAKGASAIRIAMLIGVFSASCSDVRVDFRIARAEKSETFLLRLGSPPVNKEDAHPAMELFERGCNFFITQ
jgi:predicted RNA-binding protein